MPRHRLPSLSAAISVKAEPRNGSKSTGAPWLRTGLAMHSSGLCVGRRVSDGEEDPKTLKLHAVCATVFP